MSHPGVYKEPPGLLLDARTSPLLKILSASQEQLCIIRKDSSMMPFKILSLLLVSLSVVLMEENGTRTNAKNPRILQKKYSEGTLASDYSQTLDNMLKKNFVEWLLTRRENAIDNSLDPSKREAEHPTLWTSRQDPESGSLEVKDFLTWLLQNMRKLSLALPKGSSAWKDNLQQEFLAWLISADLCRPTSSEPAQ